MNFSRIALLSAVLVSGSVLAAVAQTQDDRPTIAVPMFKCDKSSLEQYMAPITQKVTEVLKSSKRFIVVSRSADEVENEREFQRSEEFLDRKLGANSVEEVSDIVDQDKDISKLRVSTDEQGNVVFYGADYVLQGEIRKLDIVKIKNADGSTNGYKALIGLQLSVTTTESNTISEAVGFSSLPLKVAMFSPQRAVDDALMTLEGQLNEYFLTAFPLMGRVVKVVPGGVMINVGQKHGVKKGDRFTVSYVEQMDGEKMEVTMGTIKVTGLSGTSFSECSLGAGGKEIVERFNMAHPMSCRLVKK